MEITLIKFGERKREISLPDGTTIGQLLSILGDPHRNGYTVRVGAHRIDDRDLERPLEPDDEVLIVPEVRGG